MDQCTFSRPDRTYGTNGLCQSNSVVCLSSVTNTHPTHTANPIEPIFGTEVTVDNRDHVLDGVWIPQREG